MTKFLEKKQKRWVIQYSFDIYFKYLFRFEQFATYINLDTIKEQTLVLPDVIESIHTYWVLKRQVKHHRYSYCNIMSLLKLG
jgi:hypothetical protein